MKPYRLSFYESGYIDPKEFHKQRFAEKLDTLITDYENGFHDTEHEENSDKSFHGCFGFIDKDKNAGANIE